jgi:hypothetical protein
MTAQEPAGHRLPRRARATVWGIDAAGEKAALEHLHGGRWPGAPLFDLVAVDVQPTGAPCPLDLTDPGHLKTWHERSWSGAWVLRPAEETCVCLNPTGLEAGL